MRRAGPFFEAVIRLRRFLTIAFVLLAVGATMFARTGGRGAAQPEKKVVDLKADVMYPIEFRDTSAVCLVGNVAFYHSGAVITCDSAVRYSEKHMECFGNVLINKNDTYVYGDRADYNGETHVATVYSDLVTVVDGDATLYTYKFLFNTKTNVGEFADGGVVTNRENQLESDRGYYYANDRTVICVDRVEIRSEEYDLTGDSVVYNLTTDHAYYFRHTNIWNTQGDYLYADRGSYDKGGELYTVTENGYILTEKQEVWSDSIDYYKLAGHAVLRGNIQIDDTEHKVLAFGDFGEYWKEPGNAFLTRRPAVVSYDTSQGDSLFMAADSMFLYTIDPARLRADSLRAAARAADSLRTDSLRTDSLRVDSLAPAAGDSVQGVRPEAPIVAARRGSLSEGRGDAKRNGTERRDADVAPRRIAFEGEVIGETRAAVFGLAVSVVVVARRDDVGDLAVEPCQCVRGRLPHLAAGLVEHLAVQNDVFVLFDQIARAEHGLDVEVVDVVGDPRRAEVEQRLVDVVFGIALRVAQQDHGKRIGIGEFLTVGAVLRLSGEGDERRHAAEK